MNDMSLQPNRTAEATGAVPIAIPLSRLVMSAANVRKTGARDGIAELAASIAAHGLRQNLNVRATAEGDRFEVVAGGRRLRALRLLAKQGKLAKGATVSCVLLGPDEDAAEISLVENTQRTAMHPDDQFTAFQSLIEGGMPLEDVAARFGVTPALVERRLKLAKVSPRLRGLFRKGELTLEHMMAFTVSDDHAAQERTWKDLPAWNRDPEDVREALTRQAVRFDTPLARFVGMAAYVAAGGTIMRDLFDEECEGYADDRLLLLTLADDRLKAVAATVQAEGWKWVKAEVERDYATSYRRVYLAQDGSDALAFSPEDMARAGAIVRINRDGEADIDRGLVHPDDIVWERNAESAERPAAKPDRNGLPAALVEDLTAHRTAALRLELAHNPAVALAATVHALAAPLLYGSGTVTSALELRARTTMLEAHVAVPGDCAAHMAFPAEARQWQARIPEEPEAFFGWCLAQSQDTLLALLAYAAGASVHAVRSRHEQAASPRLVHADALADALVLDMTAHWLPSVDGFYGRLTKAALIALVTEAQATLPVNLGALKKPEAARYVAEAMAGTGWLPVPLRGVVADPSAAS